MSGIAKGDLTQVVRPTPCCGNRETMDSYLVVKEISHAITHCVFCGAIGEADIAHGRHDGFVIHVSRLKKIPPLDESGIEEQKKAFALT